MASKGRPITSGPAYQGIRANDRGQLPSSSPNAFGAASSALRRAPVSPLFSEDSINSARSSDGGRRSGRSPPPGSYRWRTTTWPSRAGLAGGIHRGQAVPQRISQHVGDVEPEKMGSNPTTAVTAGGNPLPSMPSKRPVPFLALVAMVDAPRRDAASPATTIRRLPDPRRASPPQAERRVEGDQCLRGGSLASTSTSAELSTQPPLPTRSTTRPSVPASAVRSRCTVTRTIEGLVGESSQTSARSCSALSGRPAVTSRRLHSRSRGPRPAVPGGPSPTPKGAAVAGPIPSIFQGGDLDGDEFAADPQRRVVALTTGGSKQPVQSRTDYDWGGPDGRPQQAE